MAARRPFTARRAGETLLAFSVVNVFVSLTGSIRAVLVINAVVAAMMLAGILGTRFWPEKVRFREPGE